MKQFHVISLSIGTALLLFGLSVFMVAGFALVSMQTQTVRPDVFRPKGGMVGEIESTINEMKYGPVNVQATKEVKNGLFSRIRARRNSSIQQIQCSPVSQQTISYSYPAISYAAPVVCYPTERHLPASVPAERVEVGVEMPSALPINPIEVAIDDCATCKKDPRSEIKTGSFLCSNCRKANVGQWHTEWNADGTPVTYLCEACWQRLDESQRTKAYKGYMARQSKSAGVQGLLHQELSQ